MADEYKDPGALVLTLFDKLLDRIKSTRPTDTKGNALTGIVYSQLVLGMPIDPHDYLPAWSPAGGGTVQDALGTGQPTAAASQPTAAAGQPTAAASQPTAAAGQPTAAAGSPSSVPGPGLAKAINATWKTSQLVDTMIMVTDDGSFGEYPTVRHVSVAYETIINGMQSKPLPPIGPDVQKQIDDAKQVLYELDVDGSVLGKSKLYKTYLKNAEAYAQAKTDYNEAQTATLTNPAKAASWPMESSTYQLKVDDAYDALKTEGADKVELALDVLKSVGISMQDHMIAKARKLLDVWSLGLAGVADPTPYSYISPTGWCDVDDDDAGWQTLTVEQKDTQSHSETHSRSLAQSHFQSGQSSSSGSGSASTSFFGFSAHASAGNTSASTSDTYQAANGTQYQFHNDAKNLTITISYALCTINRPWLLGDLFYLHNWYLVGNAKNAISDGTLAGQVNDKNDALMPMIPVQFLVIRNVTIQADEKDWGVDGQTLQQMHADSKAQGKSWTAGGGGGFNCGFLSIGGQGSHSDSRFSSSFHNSDSDDGDQNFGWHFTDGKLEIKGAQIIGWLSEIVPANAPLDAPM